MTWWGEFVGAPYGEGAGAFTCWSLIRAAYAKCLGVDLPAYGEISARDLVRVARAMDRGKDDGWRRVTAPAALDVAAMCSTRGGNTVVHVGVMVDRSHVMHVEQNALVSVVPARHPIICHRILGYWRYTL